MSGRRRPISGAGACAAPGRAVFRWGRSAALMNVMLLQLPVKTPLPPTPGNRREFSALDGLSGGDARSRTPKHAASMNANCMV